MRRTLALLALAPLFAAAQVQLTTEFPADSAVTSPDDLRTRLGGKVFRIQFADGSSTRIQYNANGYAYLDTSRGFRDSGKWRVEGDKLCNEWRQIASTCSDYRVHAGIVYLKRVSNGEIIALRE
jgi:hypothetical protein